MDSHQTKGDPLVGYLVIVVPPSPRAPHMVIVDKDMRYYGRTATGNTPLTEGEIARLYERRRRWEIDQNTILDETIAQAPVEPHNDYAYLHLVIRPLISDEYVLERAKGGEIVPSMLNDLLRRMTRIDVLPKRQGYSPSFEEQRPWHRLTDGWVAYFAGDPKHKLAREPHEAFDLHVKQMATADSFVFAQQSVMRTNYYYSRC